MSTPASMYGPSGTLTAEQYWQLMEGRTRHLGSTMSNSAATNLRNEQSLMAGQVTGGQAEVLEAMIADRKQRGTADTVVTINGGREKDTTGRVSGPRVRNRGAA